MTFKDMVEADIAGVFLNDGEFAERHTVKYNGELYEDIPVVLNQIKETEHPVVPTQGVEGIHKVTAIAHIALADLHGKVPEQKRDIYINDGFAAGRPFYQRYRIATSGVDMGMIVLELEAYDE